MNANKAMSQLLLNTQPTGNLVNEEYITFIEWEDCILIKALACDLPRSIDNTCYSDRTDCKASINHLHSENLSEGLDVMFAWEKWLSVKYPGRPFVIVVSSELDGTEVVVRFYQNRLDEPSWINDVDLENYNNEALLIRKI